MKILIVSGNYYPTISPRAFRTTELARELARQGHSVRVLIPENQRDYQDEFSKYGVIVKQFPKINFKKLNVKHSFGGKINHKINRLLELLFEYPTFELLFLVNTYLIRNEYTQYHLLISIASPYPIHWGVAKALSKRPELCKRWIADCGDPYMGVTLDTFRKPFYFRFVEKWFCRKVSFLTVPTVGAINGYYPEFRNKIRVIPQGFRIDNVKLYSGKICNKIPTFAYAGVISLGIRNPIPVIDYLIERKKKFKFVLFTNQKQLLNNHKVCLGESLDIRDYIDRELLLYELSKMDFLLNLDNGTEMQLPSKLIDYAIVGRPVMNINVQQLNKSIIDEFLEGDYRNGLKMPDIEDFNIINVAKKFVELSTS